MSIKNGDMPASPAQWIDYDATGEAVVREQYHGLTKREAFAKDAPVALGRMIFNAAEANEMTNGEFMTMLAEWHVMWADALLSALENTE